MTKFLRNAARREVVEETAQFILETRVVGFAHSTVPDDGDEIELDRGAPSGVVVILDHAHEAIDEFATLSRELGGMPVVSVLRHHSTP